MLVEYRARNWESKASTRDSSMRSYRRFCFAFQFIVLVIIGGGTQKEGDSLSLSISLGFCWGRCVTVVGSVEASRVCVFCPPVFPIKTEFWSVFRVVAATKEEE